MGDENVKNKAVILGNNYYIGLSTIRCLGIHGVYTVAMDYSEEERYGAASKYVNEKHVIPHYRKDKEMFIQYLIDYGKRQTTTPVLIPCHDSYVEVIDEYLLELKKYYHIPQTEQGLYTKVMDKDSLFHLAKDNGVRVPETVEANDPKLYEKVEKMIYFPCLVKPVDSPSFMKKFRKKLFQAENKDELQEFLQRAKEADEEVIIQRIITGFDDHMHTFDAYVDQNLEITHWTTCQKLRQYPINFGASVYTVQKYIPELYDLSASFIKAIGFKGFLEIEYKKDMVTGDFYLIEINARITNLNSLLYDVGLNFPYIMYCEMIGQPLEPKAVKETTNRAFWYGFEDLLAIKGYVQTKQLSIPSIVKSLIRPKSYAIWDWQDTKPGLYFNKMMLTKVIKKISRQC